MDPVVEESVSDDLSPEEGGTDLEVSNEARTIQFKSFYWSYEETNNHDEPNELFIHVAGRSLDGKSVHCVIEDFPPTVYLELPKRVKWNKAKCASLFEYLKKTMKSNAPLDYQLLQKYNLYYLDLMNTMCLTFPTHEASRALARRCTNARTGLVIDGVGTFRAGELVVHTHNIDPIIKFTATKTIKLAGLLEVKETIPPSPDEDGGEGIDVEDRKFTTADIDLRCKWKDVEPYDPPDVLSLVIKSLFFTFDIECYSENHNSKIPDPTNPANVIFSISVVIGYYGDPARKKYLLTLCNPKDIPDVTITRFVTEKELLLAFRNKIEDANPDALCTYNGMKFDWNYIIARAEKLGIYMKLAQISRVVGKRAELKTVNWSSSAYGDQIFRYLDPCGRSNVDVLIEVERNYKLIKYSLDYVSEFFLNQHKEDVTPRQLFMLYQLTTELTPVFNELENGEIDRDIRIKLKKRVQVLLPRRRCHGEVLKIRTNLMNAKTGKQFKSFIRDPLTLTGFYNVQDSVLTIDLCEKLNLWTTMESMSNTMNVPMSYLHTRGQQIKVLAQVYRETIFEDIIIPCRPKPKEEDLEKYQGAIVIEANPGDYDNVVCFDFESLYPSVMIAYNICYTTLLRDDDPTPDAQCHVLDWNDHIGCLKRGTTVSLINRSAKIENMYKYNSGDVLGYDDASEGVGRYKQTNFFNQGMKECVKLTLEDGSILECTPDHRIMSSDGEWIEAGEIIENSTRVKISYVPPMFYMGNERFTLGDKTYTTERLRKLMHLLGLLWSDGHNAKIPGNGGGRSVIYVGHDLDIQSVQSDLKDIFDVEVIPKKQNAGWGLTIPGKYGSAIRGIPGIMFGRRLNQIRTLPEFLKVSGKGIIASFLSGLFGGDGHTFTFSAKAQAFSSIGLSWTSDDPANLEPIFTEIREYLKLFDIDSSFTNHPSSNKKSTETRLNIAVKDTIKFKEKIGFAHCVHKSMRLEAGCRYLRLRDNVWDQQKWVTDRTRELRNESNCSVDQACTIAKNELKGYPIYNKYYANPTTGAMYSLLRSKQIKPMFSREHFPGPMEFMKTIGAESLFISGSYGVNIDKKILPTFNLLVIHKENIGIHQVYDLEIDTSHTFLANGVIVHNCTHDVQRRKKKAADVLCKHHHYRFRKVVTLPDGTRLHEGVMPKLERKLLITRKGVKKDMAKLEAKLKMVLGTAIEDDLAFYKKVGWEIVQKGSLTPEQVNVLKVGIKVLNAEQLSLKISSNSVRADTPIPCMINGVFSYKNIEHLAKKGSWIAEENGDEYGTPIDGLKVWSDTGFTPVNYVFRHQLKKDELVARVLTHTGCIDVTGEHSLLDEDGFEMGCSDSAVGDKLMHMPVPLPPDTPDAPMYRALSDQDIREYIIRDEVYQNISCKMAFVWGLFFAEGTSGVWGSLHDVKSTWIIYNQDYELLVRAKNILEECYPAYNFGIHDYRESSSVYHLKPSIKNGESIKTFATGYRTLFYDNRARKKIPEVILNSPLNVRQAFFVGYYAGDGNRHLKTGIVVSNKGTMGTSQLCYLAKSLGYIVSISNLRKAGDDNIYRLQCCIKFRNQKPTAIKSLNLSPQMDPIKTCYARVVRNGINIVFQNGLCVYKGINIHCERTPRQTILDTLDKAAILFSQTRGIITDYHTKTKKVTYECLSCGDTFDRELRLARMNDNARNVCKCAQSLENLPPPDAEDDVEDANNYVYDIETASHHFAGGVGDLIVHNSAYGGLGAQMGFIPLVPGAASVTAKGRELIMDAIRYVLTKYDGGEIGIKAKLVYGDTDSSMITFVDKSTDESFLLGDKISKEISHYLKTKLIGLDEEHTIVNPDDEVSYRIDKYPRNQMENLEDEHKIKIHEYDANPINLQFENLYKRYLLLTKKRYVARATNRMGKITAKIKKGVVLVRRENCMYLKDTYEPMVEAIMDKKSESDVMNILYDQIQKLFTRQIPDANLIKYTGVKNIMHYARKKEKKQGRSVMERVYLDENNEVIEDPIGPLDPRLVYPNLPQVILAIKMMVRGDDVPPNTRLEYILAENDDADHQGEHAEDYTFYRENKHSPFMDKGTGNILFAGPSEKIPRSFGPPREVKVLKPDYLMYIDKQLSKPITELLLVKYPKEFVLYEKIEDAFARCIEGLNDLSRRRVKVIKIYERTGSLTNDEVGWKVVCEKCANSRDHMLCIRHAAMVKDRNVRPRVYKYKGVQAQIQYILDSAAKKKYIPGIKNEIDATVHPELIKICLAWKSRHIVDKLHKSFGVRKRTVCSPTQTGAKLPVMTANMFNDAFLTKTVGSHTRGTMVTLMDITEVVDDMPTRAKNGPKKYKYTVRVKGIPGEDPQPEEKEPEILRGVPRDHLTSYRIKDSKIMKDILLYRTQHKILIKELDRCLSPVTFVGKQIKEIQIRLNRDEEDGDAEELDDMV